MDAALVFLFFLCAGWLVLRLVRFAFAALVVALSGDTD